jgi:hypothetical protein
VTEAQQLEEGGGMLKMGATGASWRGLKSNPLLMEFFGGFLQMTITQNNSENV